MSLLSLLIYAGCAAKQARVVEAFPPTAVASPWILRDEVWTGTFDEAAPALGKDAETWRQFRPTRAWLAVYCHESEPRRRLKVRGFAFGTREDARRAFEAFRPADASSYSIGDAGCWTRIGVLFQWGRLVFDIFGHEASWSSEVQSSLVAAYIAKRMPPGAPENPQ